MPVSRTYQFCYFLSPIFLILALGSCATNSQNVYSPGNLNSEHITSKTKKDDNKSASKAQKTRLDGDILFKVIAAEIAGQRGDIDTMLNYYMELARETLDLSVIERATRIAVYARDNNASYEAASLWIDIEPKNPDPHQVMTVMNIRKGNFNTALFHLNLVLESTEGDVDQKLWMVANFLGAEEDKSMVIKLMDKIMSVYMEDVDALYAYAHVSSRIGDDERAKSLLEKILTLKPDNNTAAVAYIGLLQKNGETEKALNWLESVLKKQEDNFDLRMTYARLLTDAKYYNKAREQFKFLYDKTPDDPDLLYALGLLTLQENNSDESKKYFNRLIELKEYVFDANYYLGRIAEEKNDLESASDYYKSVHGGENYFDAFIRISFIYAKQGNIESALNNIRSIEKPKGNNRIILIQAESEILIDEKRYDEAFEVFTKAINEESHPDLLYSRAMLAEKIDRIDLLEADLMRIIENDPNNATALNALGYTLADRSERLDEAYNYINRAYEISPNDFYILDSMGWVLYRLGRFEEAIDFLQQALDLRNDPEVAAHLGEVYWVMGNKKAAEDIWRTALKNKPKDDKLLKIIERFKP